MTTKLPLVAGKLFEELTGAELETLAIEAGREARDKAKQQGVRLTEWREGQLLWVDSQGNTEPVTH